MTIDKIRENRLRRAIERQGYRLTKSRRRDPRAYDFGRYMIIEPNRKFVVAGANPNAFSMTLDDVERWVERD
jgi:hypothetical protein